MQQVAFQKKGHKKLKVFLGVVALLIAGYFVYKYTYIYVERRKYDQATVAINKVADDLRSQGIETEFSKTCGHNEAKFRSGALSCGLSIMYLNTSDTGVAQEVTKKFMTSLDANGFKRLGGDLDYGIIPFNIGDSQYSLVRSNFPCALFYTTISTDIAPKDQIGFSCGKPSRFSIF